MTFNMHLSFVTGHINNIKVFKVKIHIKTSDSQKHVLVISQLFVVKSSTTHTILCLCS